MRYYITPLLLSIGLSAAANDFVAQGARRAIVAVQPPVSWTCQSSVVANCTSASEPGCVNNLITRTGGCTTNSSLSTVTSGSIASLPSSFEIVPEMCGTGSIKFTPTVNVRITASEVTGMTMPSSQASCIANSTCSLSWKTTTSINSTCSPMSVTLNVAKAPAVAS